MNISSVEEYIGYTVANQLMQKAFGDSTEYELIFQAVMEQMQNNNSTQVASEETEGNVISTSSAMSLDSLPLIRVGENNNISASDNTITYNLSNLLSSGITSVSGTNSSINNYLSSSDTSAEMSEIYEAVNKYAEMYNVDPALVLAVIKAESNFDSTATSGAGAVGLMQVMDFNLEAAGVVNGYDVEENVRAGVSLLKSYLDDCSGNVSMALMAYNAGPGTMLNRGVTSSDDLYKMPTETQNYVPKVLAYYSEFSS